MTKKHIKKDKNRFLSKTKPRPYNNQVRTNHPKERSWLFRTKVPLIVTILIAILSPLIGVFGSTLFNQFVNRPNIIGTICSVQIGDMIDYSNNNHVTCLMAFVSLTNSSKSSIHISDYKMEVDTGSGYFPIDRTYNPEQFFSEDHSFNFETTDSYIDVPDLTASLHELTKESIEYGIARNGILIFPTVADKLKFDGKDNTYRITITDVLDSVYVIENAAHTFINNGDQLTELFGIKIHLKPTIVANKRITLHQIPEPIDLTRSVFKPQGNFKGPFYIGLGDTDLVCSDGTVLAQSIINGQLRNMVFVSPVNGKYYEQEEVPEVTALYLIRTTVGTFNFSGPVILRNDVIITGSNP